MGLFFALLFLLAPWLTAADTLQVVITVGPDAAQSAPPISALEAGLQRLFGAAYGRFVDLSFDDSPAPAAAASAAPSAADARAGVSLELQAGTLRVSTNLARAGISRALVSTVPSGAPASLLATISGDLAFLFFLTRDFSAFPLSAPPALTATLQTDTLQALTGWDTNDLEPIGLSASAEQVIVCFPHRYLTLGPRFRITADTVRDIHAQTTGREKLQLSGAVAGTGDELLLLSEREGKIAWLTPRLGARKLIDAPGLSGRGARMLDRDFLAVLSNANALSLYSADAPAPRTLHIAAPYVPVFALDRERNIWAWDAEERRIRILTPDGREVFAIKPLLKASTMQLPQQLEVFDDGSFLLGGSGEVWRFENTGIPVWRMSRIPGRPGEQLPSVFALAANITDGSFTLLDVPSRRLLAFASSSASSPTGLASVLTRLDGNNPADLRDAAALALQDGLSLMSWQFGDLLARRDGSESERASARIAILKEKTQLYKELADSVARDLLYEKADVAYLRAGESARQLTAEAPDDQEAARLLEGIVSRRQEARAILSSKSDVRILLAAAIIEHTGAGVSDLAILLRVQNAGTEALKQLRLHVNLPTVGSTPSLVGMDSLQPGEERDLSVRLGLPGPVPASALSSDGVPAAALITYERGIEGVASQASFSVPVLDSSSVEATVESLVRRAAPGDPLLAGLRDALLARSPGDGKARDPIVELAGMLDALGSLRTSPVAAGGAPSSGPRPETMAGRLSMRGALRALSPDELDWSVLTLSLGSTLGIPVGVIAWQDRAFVLLDTGMMLSDAVASIPGLDRFRRVLTALSRDGRLCVPLSGRLLPGGPGASANALVDALARSAEKGVENAAVWWLDPPTLAAGSSTPLPVPFPLQLPSVPLPLSRDALRLQIVQALEQRQ